ncbi:CRISPR-associated endonuclease Cas9 2 [Fructobacillus sp. EFB-N1]|uniref:type II CRISPR RNA-guided endonuclease Cas9 n=1 Tax=Fructobacillus sp. EFB-N1 TaxID=1658766 RepID=UPI00064D9E43|nr:type II CRISPR RNA-guided endonuclease Cas9 [Fructobacillus sp. EFB-N1]KMK52871.1 CRISPR-associated endonuclease Cas9 2 [Fructobacillus sp. EFB-N1]
MGYNIGLDIGTGSVGWAALTDEGKLARAKGKNLIGVRLFDSAQSAAQRRSYRTTRRRLSRRKWRLRLLENIFSDEMGMIDENFFARLKYSYVHPKDEVNNAHYYGGYLFPTQQETHDFHEKFQTIYHLRLKLMIEDCKFDLREIYLAMHHIVKYRGHFLNSQSKMTIGDSYNPRDFQQAIQNYAEAKGLIWSLNDAQEMTDVLVGQAGFGLSKKAKAERLLSAFSFDTKEDKKAIQAILAGIVGNTTDFTKIFNRERSGDELKKWKLKLDSEAFDEQSQAIVDELDDDEMELFNAIRQAFDGFTLMDLLGDQTSISAAMVKRYQQHHDDLKMVKEIAKKQGLSHQDFSKIYTAFLKDDTDKGMKALLDKADLADDVLVEIQQRIESHDFLPKQRTKANSVIPYQLHLAELEKIIENQGKYYPFLLDTFTNKAGETINKLVELVKFRVPYYVGPMVTAADVEKAGGDATNHWVKRNEGYEKSPVTPWNFDQVFNRDQAAQDFIDRLTGTDTYLIGEPTLLKNSLKYQLFTVLNELNNVKINGHKIDEKTKHVLIQDLFKSKKTVSEKAIKDYYLSQGMGEIQIVGLADKTKFNSNLSSYIDLSKTFDAEFMENPANQELLENIIQIQTVFEDVKIAERELQKLALPDEQVQQLAKTHYTGWGNLSDKLLSTPIIQEGSQKVSILNKLQTTSKNFMSIITDNKFGVQQWIQEQNTAETADSIQDRIDELTTAPANKRGIKQAFNVLFDIQKAMGEEPNRVYLEFAKETQNSVRTNSRYNRLKDLYKSKTLSDDVKALKEELESQKSSLQSERIGDRLYLYFLQQGKDMYTGQPINIDKLSTDYDIDHIIPQAYTKDDSIDNRVLVSRPENARKSDSATYTTEVQQSAGGLWKSLKNAGFISQKKYDRLTKGGDYSKGQKTGFIARQLVETRQIIKNVASLIESEFSQTKAVAIRSEITADMRRLVAIKKHREINSFHHAFDALLITAAGQYMQARYPDRDGANVYNEFDYYTNTYLKELRQSSSSSQVRRLKPFGFVVGTMAKGNENWSEDDTQYLRHVMNFKNILTTRRNDKDNGALNKETIYAVDPKAKLIGTNKKRQDVSLYGGYIYPYSAYMTLVRANGKNLLVKVTISAAEKIKSGQIELSEYVQQRPEVKKFEKILINKLAIGQLVNNDGNLIYLTSYEFYHNAKQLWLPTEEADLISQLNKDSSDEDLIKGFDILTSPAILKRFPFYELDLKKLVNIRDKFIAVENKFDILMVILKALQLDAAQQKPVKMIDKKSADWKDYRQRGGIKLSDTSEIIYQSTTGIFEKRVKISNLL